MTEPIMRIDEHPQYRELADKLQQLREGHAQAEAELVASLKGPTENAQAERIAAVARELLADNGNVAAAMQETPQTSAATWQKLRAAYALAIATVEKAMSILNNELSEQLAKQLLPAFAAECREFSRLMNAAKGKVADLHRFCGAIAAGGYTVTGPMRDARDYPASRELMDPAHRLNRFLDRVQQIADSSPPGSAEAAAEQKNEGAARPRSTALPLTDTRFLVGGSPSSPAIKNVDK